MLRLLTAGESHGKVLIAILEGMVANLPLTENDIDKELSRRREGIGRSERMSIEQDKCEILSGIRKGKTIGSPIALMIKNADSAPRDEKVTKLRPGHADLAGAMKYGQDDVRNILERASARETASRVAAGAVAKKLLIEFGIELASRVISLGGSADQSKWETLVRKTAEEGDSLGGIFEIKIKGAPVGLGSHVHFDRRLDALLAGAVMGIPAIKGVEFASGFENATKKGSQVHDEIFIEAGKFKRKTNNAGGIEGGISNGEDILIRAAMKPIATLKKPLRSVDLATRAPVEAHFERADVCAVHAAGVIGEAVAAMAIANAFLEKFGGDSLEELRAHFKSVVL